MEFVEGVTYRMAYGLAHQLLEAHEHRFPAVGSQRSGGRHARADPGRGPPPDKKPE